jgi:hypothetical protein
MKSIQALREQRAAKAKELHDLVNNKDEGVETTTSRRSTTPAWRRSTSSTARSSASATSTRASLTSAHRQRDRRGRAPRPRQEVEGAKLFAKWLRVGENGLTPRTGRRSATPCRPRLGSEGGYTVPVEVANSVLDALKAFGGMRAVATVIRTDGGNDMNFPTSDGTSETGELLAQNASAAAADRPSASRRCRSTSTARSRRRADRAAAGQQRRHRGVRPQPPGHPPRPHHQHALHDRHRLIAAERHRDGSGLGQGRHHRPDRHRDLRRPGRPAAQRGSGLSRARQLPVHDERRVGEGHPQDQGRPEPPDLRARLRRRHPSRASLAAFRTRCSAIRSR